jgi:small-conductance mechanosensitive channel
MPSPAPAVRLAKFGDSALEFQLLVWTSTHVHRKGLLTSALNFAILEKFNANGVRIPFPQREVLLKSDRPDTPPQSDPAPGEKDPPARML